VVFGDRQKDRTRKVGGVYILFEGLYLFCKGVWSLLTSDWQV